MSNDLLDYQSTSTLQPSALITDISSEISAGTSTSLDSLLANSKYTNLREWKFYDPIGYNNAIEESKRADANKITAEERKAQETDYWLTGDTYVPIFSEATDFLGGALWGGVEGISMGAATVWDIAADYDEGIVDPSELFGYKSWEQESWASKTGYVLSSAISALFGIGLVGKGVQGVSRSIPLLANATRRTLAREGSELLAKNTDEVLKGITKTGISDDVAKNIFKYTDEAIASTADDAAKMAPGYYGKFGSQSIRSNPDHSLQTSVQHLLPTTYLHNGTNMNNLSLPLQ